MSSDGGLTYQRKILSTKSTLNSNHCN